MEEQVRGSSANISIIRKHFNATGPSLTDRTAEERQRRVLVPNLKPKPFQPVKETKHFYHSEVSSEYSVHKVVFLLSLKLNQTPTQCISFHRMLF